MCAAHRGIPPQRRHSTLQSGHLHGRREVLWGLINTLVEVQLQNNFYLEIESFCIVVLYVSRFVGR